ncbi:MAG: hypothetical protein J7L15_03660 [Clostridiales bacterium]|nr:hypothetical protein [Clostridiales bacterium]
MKTKQYKIIYNKKNDTFNIKIGTEFLFWTNWKLYGRLAGALDHVWLEPFVYETKEMAIDAIIILIAKDEEAQAILDERQSKADNYKDLILSKEILNEKFPELLL